MSQWKTAAEQSIRDGIFDYATPEALMAIREEVGGIREALVELLVLEQSRPRAFRCLCCGAETLTGHPNAAQAKREIAKVGG